MAPLDDTTPETRFDSFDVHRTSYKKIGEHAIEVAILVPKNIKPGKHPLIVKFHGGGLVTGDCLYADWIAAFWIPFMHRTSSIVVLPNYRLLPEHTGSDILQDLGDFWAWFNAGGVDDYLSTTPTPTPLELDSNRVLVTGDSAGGYMALMSGLLHAQQGLKAILAQYPMTNYLRMQQTDTLFGLPTPGPEVLAHHLDGVVPGAVVSSAVPPARAGLSYCLAAYDKYLAYFGKEPNMWPIECIENAGSMPPTWIIHGGADSAVNVEDSQAFVKRWTEREVRGEVKLSLLPGMEHGFDIGLKESEEEWLKEGLEWVEEKWLG
ncbi:Alpha/Beta hydrolase protein [Ampelomyces quisqualis]|uniref:Alpha/Beta hydrolase protein n=1 Tax=Ampelomyces quisqualis TaxID=50730 RepID=A0A6A5QXJ9_AMPQU|nr:Alpha/Beta hydrolase protein [Ampelomyces quisqualis]